MATDEERAAILHKVSSILGFKVREEECSLDQRKEVNKLALDMRQANVFRNRDRAETVVHAFFGIPTFYKYWIGGFLLLFSVIVLFIYVRNGNLVAMLLGIVLSVLAVLLFFLLNKMSRARTGRKQLSAREIGILEADIEIRIKELAKAIGGYLSSSERAR